MKNKPPLIFLFLLPLICSNCNHSSYPAINRSKATPFHQYFQNNEDFNGNVLIAVEDKIIFNESYGFTDVNKTAPLNKLSKFNVGSICKAFPAMALLKLAEEGKISFDQKVEEFLDDLPSWSAEVAINELLFYRSGLPSADFQKENSDETLTAQLKNIKTLLFKPGIDQHYSNLNNFLQAKIIEQITRIPFSNHVDQTIFKPLKMKGAIYTDFPPTIENKNMTYAYSEAFGDDISKNPNVKKFDANYMMVYMTTLDLYQWSKWVYRKYDKTSDLHKVFFKKTDHADDRGPIGQVHLNNDELVINENLGAAYSFESLVYSDYQQKNSIVLMTNNRKPNQLKTIKEDIIGMLQ